jgi:hypothetical protein
MTSFLLRLQVLACVVGSILLSALAVGAPASTVLDETRTTTAISAYGGTAAWSAYDAASGLYRLRIYRNGAVTDAAVPPRRSQFDADVGPAADGTPVIVYPRCRKDPQPQMGSAGLPLWSYGRGCDIHRYRPVNQIDQVLTAAASKVSSEFVPSIWGSHLAFWSVAEPGHTRRAFIARLHLIDLRGPRRSRSFVTGGNTKVAVSGGALDGELPSPTTMDLHVTTMAYGWNSPSGCSATDPDSTGAPDQTQIFKQTLTQRSRLATQCGTDILGPFFVGSDIDWMQTGGAGVVGISSDHDPKVPLPSDSFASATLDGSELLHVQQMPDEHLNVVSDPRPAPSGP